MICNVRDRQPRGNYTKPRIEGSKLAQKRLEGRIAKPSFLRTRRILERLQAIQKMEAGLSAQRIYQDLVEENGFLGSYQSVKRFVRWLKQRQPQRVWRIECQPGEEMQVDFGLGAPIEQSDGKRRRSWVLRAVLSYSRKGYSEAVMRQDTESFLRCLEKRIASFWGRSPTVKHR